MMTNEKFEKEDYYSALEDGLMTCLEHEKDALQLERMESLLTDIRTLMKQETETPSLNVVSPAPTTNDKDREIIELTVKIDSLNQSLSNAMEAGKSLHHSFGKKLIWEFIQQHIYTTLNSNKWKRLDKQKYELAMEIKECDNPKRLRQLMKDKEFIMGSIENLLVTNAYYGALNDSMIYPDTMEELRCMFGDGARVVASDYIPDKSM